MLPTPYRLALRQEKDFFTQAHRVSTTLFFVYAGEVVAVPQLAVVIPKKKINKTVTRNLLKRHIHQLFLKGVSDFPQRKMVLYYKVSYEASYHDLAQEMKTVATKVRQVEAPVSSPK